MSKPLLLHKVYFFLKIKSQIDEICVKSVIH